MENSVDLPLMGSFETRYAAFLETITQLRSPLHRYCARMAGSVMDGEDVVPEALFEAYVGDPKQPRFERTALVEFVLFPI